MMANSKLIHSKFRIKSKRLQICNLILKRFWKVFQMFFVGQIQYSQNENVRKGCNLFWLLSRKPQTNRS